MFSALGNIFSPKPRQAENTDTHLGIRRHDPDQEQRRKKKESDDQDLFVNEDNATVSVSALSSFLANFLKSLPAENASKAPAQKTDSSEQESIEISDEAERTPEKRPATGEGAQAMSAYQSASQSTVEPAGFSTEDTRQAAESLGLHASEVRTIHQLLDDLKILSERGIENLVIERSSSFLQSLVNAVEKAKAP